MDLDATLSLLAADPGMPVDLAEAALLIARDEYPDLDVAAYLARLDLLAAAVAPRLYAGTLADKVGVLAQFLFDEHAFGGNDDDYYDPRNSYLNDVLDRKTGIPITLSLLAAAVGRRAGLAVVGVGLPGHFVAKATDDGGGEVVFDPFHKGRVLDAGGCEALVRAVTGEAFTATPEAFAPTPSGVVVARVLNNLKGVYLRASDFARAARVTGRLAQLTPHDPLQRRDLGVTLVQAGQPGRAIKPLESYLTDAPAADDADTVRDILKRAKAAIARWN